MLRTGRLPAPHRGRSSSASTPGSRPTPGVLLPGTLASPRAGLTPAGCRELGARLHPRSSFHHSAPELLDAHSCGIAWGGCSRPAGLAPAAPGGGVDAGPRRPARVKGRRSGPAGTPRALDAARERRGTGRVAATTADPRPGAGARTRRRHRRRGRSITPTAAILPGSSVPARSCLGHTPRRNAFRARGREPSRQPAAPFRALGRSNGPASAATATAPKVGSGPPSVAATSTIPRPFRQPPVRRPRHPDEGADL